MLSLSALLQERLQQIAAIVPVELTALTEEEAAVLAMSDFVADSLRAHPEWWQTLCQAPAKEWQQYEQQLATLLSTVEEENELMRLLRQFRQQTMLRIAWRQIVHSCSTRETLQQLSFLADAIIVAARDWLYRTACQEWGTPCDEQGEAQPLLVIGMGKLGGGELNFSSDIDLLFTYPQRGSTQGGRRQWDNDQFFTRLGQRLIKVLDQQTVDGRVYRVDMRLRPFGDSGPLVASFNALEEYYQEQGRDWERYAMVKTRVLGPEQQEYHQQWYTLLRPFVYRRYIDFSVIQSMREMKEKIAREVRRRGLQDNIKLGAGGIREIEFIAQVFQLIRGGREPRLQNKSLLTTLQTLAELDLLAATQVTTLEHHYLFLRRLENLLQSIADQQTQTLPTDPLNQARLAWGMGFETWQALQVVIRQTMAQVREIFNTLIGEEGTEQEEEQDTLEGLWSDQLEGEDLAQLLPELSPQTRQLIEQTLTSFRQELNKRMIGVRGRIVLDQLMPRLLSTICRQPQIERVLPWITRLIASIVSRTAYLELLLENQTALRYLVRLCAASPMIASQLARYPMLLDPSVLYRPLALNAYQDELRQYLSRIPEEDEEQHLEALRQFKQTQLLRIAAADIAGALPVMKVSDHLTCLAEAIIGAVVQQAWHKMVARHGQPMHLDQTHERGFAVLAYGKLGGWELGYGSDLDLVFLIDCPAEVMTSGPRVIDGRQFYLRLAQRIIHLFNTRTVFGVLYEVDARLRPSGESGLLVSTLEAFADYQMHEAWTWEHQALVRARMIYGSADMAQRFREIRQQTLCRVRNPATLQQEVRDMRSKMVQHLGNKQTHQFDIKHDRDGIVDIEFIAQYLVLRFAAEQPALTRWSDNMRIFELMAQYGVMTAQEAEALTAVYINMRDTLHHLALQQLPSSVELTWFMEERQQVKASWYHWLEKTEGTQR